MSPSAVRRLSAPMRRQLLSITLVTLLLLPNFLFNPRLILTARADTSSAVSIAAFDTAMTQNFDTLVSTGTGTLAANTPAGWGFVETAAGANTTYTAGTGSSTTGDTYSFGVAGTNPVTDRAFGQLRSGNVVTVLGAKFTNNTGGTITSLDVAYTGEEWRLGTAGRTDRMDFQFSTNATDLSTGTYTDVDALDFTTPNTATTGAKDGNAVGNRTALSSTISSLSIPPGAPFWIRWTDVDATSADDGLAIDDFSMTAHGTVTPTPNLSIGDVSANEGDGGQTTFNFNVSLSSAAGAGGITFNVDTADGTAAAPGDYTAVHTSFNLPQGATGATVAVQVNGDTAVEPNETFFVNVTNVSGANLVDGQGQGTIVNDDTAPVATNVIINEVDSDTPGTDAAEFVELYDGGVGNTSLNGLVLVFYNGNGDVPYAAFDLDNKTTDANGYFIVGNSAVAGAGVTFNNNTLQNGADAVALYAGDASSFTAGTPLTTANLFDAFVYDTGQADDAGLLALLNSGQPQVNEATGGNAPSNSSQRCPNGSGGGRNTSTYGQGAPTPGAANSCIPVGPQTSPSGAGSANPNALTAGSTTLLTVTVTPGANPASTGLMVTANLSAIGGSAAQSFSGSGNTFTFTATVEAATTPGAKSLPFTVTDLEGRSGTGAISLNVIQPPQPVEHLVISQVYGGGGNASATYHNDFVEIYNPTQQTVSLHHWTLQYASDDGSGWESNKVFLGGTVAPGEYYLVALGSNGANGNVLPAANVSGGVNLSGANGKIALVSNLEGLAGVSETCPLDDPDLVDFVGYGSSANCGEGGTKAPTLSNTTAAIRLNGGATDTDNNAADFFAGTPTPHRTAPIVELGPVVIGTDPRSNGFNAPRDASLTISFTEPVEIDTNSAWFHIQCATTGAHDSATVAGGGTTFIIIPNTNFANGEQCSATIFKNFVHDQDTDDAGPDSDTLDADYTWTFTTSNGTAPPYTPDVHLALGNPSGAVADLGQPNNYLMEKPEFALSYNRDAGGPNWVSWHLSDEWVGTLQRVDTFRPDPAVPAEWYRVLHTDYTNSGFDRGHMTPNADRDKETSAPINQATFLMTNMVAQSPDNNRGPWAAFENYLRTLLPTNEVYIVAGPAGSGGTGSNGFATTIAGGHVAVPSSTWKVALVLPKGTNDLSRVTAATRTIAINIPNVQGILSVDWHNYLTTVDAVESMTGYDFFANVPDAVENSIEAGTDGANPPATAGQSSMTAEDTPLDITLAAANPSGGALTYFVTQPSHGTLTGTGAARTYTPAAGYHGPDSFTFNVSDGTSTSNTSTVTINVTEVNDAPAAAGDLQTTPEDVPLVFAASDLTANDDAGAPDEAGQTLTVSSVTATADTHGTISLAGGQITYTPAADYNGTASFTYEVCDNGTTSGSPDSQCATATVTVTVNAVNDAPTLSNVPAAATIPEQAAYTFTAQASDVDGQTLTFTLVGAPAGATINPSTGQFNWTPSEAHGGTGSPYVFKVRVSDGIVNVDSNVSLTVTEANSAPTLAHIGDRTVLLGGTLTFTAAGADADVPAQTLTYSLTGVVPAGATINPTTGVFNWTPTAAQAGQVHIFGVRVTDSLGQFAEETVQVGAGHNWSGLLLPAQEGAIYPRALLVLPVRFKLTGASANVRNLVARLWVAPVQGGVAGAEFAPAPALLPNLGNQFHYNSLLKQYLFEWKLAGLPAGVYRLRVDMGDGVVRVTNITLR